MADRDQPDPDSPSKRGVCVRELTFTYGRLAALTRIDLAVRPGQVHAVCGPHGAGKSTLVTTLLGLRRPSSGQASVLGLDCRSRGADIRRRVGVVTEHSHFPARATVADVLALMRVFFPSWDAGIAGSCLQRHGVRLESVAAAMPEVQRVWLSVAVALACRPDMYVLDSPVDRLEETAAAEILATVVDDARGAGRTVLMTAQAVSGAVGLADSLSFLNAGRLRLTVPSADVMNVSELRVAGAPGTEPPDGTVARLGADCEDGAWVVLSDLPADQAVAALTEQYGACPIEVRTVTPDEAAFARCRAAEAPGDRRGAMA